MRRCVLFAGVIGLASLLPGCNGLTERQRMWLQEGQAAYDSRLYDRAIRYLTQFIQAAPDGAEVGRAYYVRALAHARAEDRMQARSDLVRAIEMAEDSQVRWRAYTVLGTLDYEDDQWEAAAQSYREAARLAPNEQPSDVILYRLAVALERSGRWTESREVFRQVLESFPDSGVAASAERRLQLEPDHFAVQVGVFASRQNAENLVLDLERQGLRPYIRREPRNDVLMHVVLIGQYDEYGEAVRALSYVKGYAPGAVLWP